MDLRHLADRTSHSRMVSSKLPLACVQGAEAGSYCTAERAECRGRGGMLRLCLAQHARQPGSVKVTPAAEPRSAFAGGLAFLPIPLTPTPTS